MAGSGTKGQTGIGKRVVKLLEDNPTKLFTRVDVAEALEEDVRAADNSLYNNWRAGRIFRHTETDEATGFNQYAFEIDEEHAQLYVKQGRKSSGELPNAREIRTQFAQAMNTLAKLEDMVTGVVELAEDTERKMKKIEDLLR